MIASLIPSRAHPAPAPAARPLLPRAIRLPLSLAILIYFAAVIIAPLSGPPPASELSQVILQPFRPLLGAVYLGHGYRFFAPNPGPGHSIRWTITLPDGTTRAGTIPDAAADQPRLLYHRRFMVAEKIAVLVPPPFAPAEIRQEARRDWLPLVKGVAANLLRTEGGTRVRLDLVEHYLPGPEEVVAGTAGADLVTPLGTYAVSEGLALPAGSPRAVSNEPLAAEATLP